MGYSYVYPPLKDQGKSPLQPGFNSQRPEVIPPTGSGFSSPGESGFGQPTGSGFVPSNGPDDFDGFSDDVFPGELAAGFSDDPDLASNPKKELQVRFKKNHLCPVFSTEDAN